ncbi:MAG TPA: hypothetical protein VGJ15_07915 [Pirellulales bacterium]
MSLLLKALSRAEAKLLAPADEVPTPPIVLPATATDSSSPIEQLPVAADLPTATIESPVDANDASIPAIDSDRLITELFQESEPSSPPHESLEPFVEPVPAFNEAPSSVVDFSTPVPEPFAAASEASIAATDPFQSSADLSPTLTAPPSEWPTPVIEPATLAFETSTPPAPLAQGIEPVEPPFTFASIAPPEASAEVELQAPVPIPETPPIAPAVYPSPTKPSFDVRLETTSEYILQRLDELQNLIKVDIANFDLPDFESANVDINQFDLTNFDPPMNVDSRSVMPALHAAMPAQPPRAPVAMVPIQLLAPARLNVSFPASLLPSATPSAPVPAAPTLSASTAPPAPAAPLRNIKPEFRELRDQLLSRLNIAKHPTLLFVDAGREVSDAAWLLPLATCIVDRLNADRNSAQTSILIVEAAGSNCGLAQTLGLDIHTGLNHLLTAKSEWHTFIQSTPHPQIKLLGRGAEQFRCNDSRRLARLWAELTAQYDLLLVAAGPISQLAQSSRPGASIGGAAAALLPLATAAVLCVELNRTPQSAAQEAKRLLDARGIQVLGCIVQPA